MAIGWVVSSVWFPELSLLYSDRFEKLNEYNYNQWHKNMPARLHKRACWRHVKDEVKEPTGSDAASLTKVDEWKKQMDIAAGELWSCIDESQQIHVDGKEDDPVAMWKALEAAHVQKKAITRFSAYTNLLHVTKQPDESLQSLIERTSSAMSAAKLARPDDYTIDKLDGDLQIMALLEALPEEYAILKTNLLLRDSLTLLDVKIAFTTEGAQRQHNASEALQVKASPAVAHVAAGTPPGKPEEQLCVLHPASKEVKHLLKDCSLYKNILKSGKGLPGKQQHKPSAANTTKEEDFPATAQFAGDASPSTLSQLSNSDCSLCPDSGATSHMIPHRAWFLDYKAFRIPIKLADGPFIYSAGIGLELDLSNSSQN